MTEKITPDAAVQKGPQATPTLPTAKAGQVLAPSSVQPRQQQTDCVGMVLSLRPPADLLTELLKTAKGESKKFKLVQIRKQFKDCNEAVRWVNATQTQADAMPIIQPTLSTNKPRPVKQPDGSFKAEVKVDWSIDPKRSIIQLPDWTNVKSKDDKSAWQDYVNALQAHEVLHIRIAEEYTKKVSCTVSSTGASPMEAGVNLQEELNRYREAVGSLLDDLTGPNSEYDKITDHGLKQSKIGGKDVRLNCPPPAP